MILFKPQAGNRFRCIPREYVTNAFMTIRDDSTNVIVEYILVPRIGGVGNILIERDRFSVYNSTYQNMVEGHFYDLTIYTDATKVSVIYRDRIFCTDQLVDQKNGDFYDINKGQFVSTDAYNNEYIVTS